jgi:hypothetical protein
MTYGPSAISASAAVAEDKIPIVAAVPSNQAGHPINVGTTTLSGFSSEAFDKWAKCLLIPNSQVLSGGLNCLRAVTAADCHHKAVFTV